MKNAIRIFIFSTILTIAACEADRNIVPDTHTGRVPEIIGLSFTVDSSVATKRKIVKIVWGYDSIKYGTDRIKANMRDWEIYRAVEDTSLFVSRGKTFFPAWQDSSNDVQLGARDSVILFYKLFPNGYPIDNISFTGKPSDIYQIIIRKKN
jgi:hypothetical protein